MLTVKQAKEAKQRGCGFGGPVWSLNYNFHKQWCQRSDVHMANLNQENNKRIAGLQQCKNKKNVKFNNFRNKQKQCLAYAKEAKKLRFQLNKACKNSGEWSVTLKKDVDWCMTQSIGAANLKNTLHKNKITQCKLKIRQKVFLNPGTKLNRIFLPLDVCNRSGNSKKYPESLYGKQRCGQKMQTYIARNMVMPKPSISKRKTSTMVQIWMEKNQQHGGKVLPNRAVGYCTGFTKIVCRGQGALGK